MKGGLHRHCERGEAIQTAAAETFWIASLTLAITMWPEMPASLSVVMPREGGASSTPQRSCDTPPLVITGSSAFADDDNDAPTAPPTPFARTKSCAPHRCGWRACQNSD